MNESFVFYSSWQEILLNYDDNIRLEVYDAVIHYASTGEFSELKNDQSKMAFSFIKNQIDHNNKKYENTCQKRKEAIERRWKKKQSIQDNTKDTNVSKENNSIKNNTKDTNVNFEMLYDNDNDNELYKSPKETMNNDKELSSKDSNSTHTKNTTRTEKIQEWMNTILKQYNNFLAEHGCKLKPVRKITEQRYDAIVSLAEKYGAKQFGIALTNFARSPYANGKTKERNRPVDFDWFLIEKNFINALENSL